MSVSLDTLVIEWDDFPVYDTDEEDEPPVVNAKSLSLHGMKVPGYDSASGTVYLTSSANSLILYP